MEKTYPTVTSTDIESGDYTGKYAIITSIARNVDVQPTIDYVTCDMYFHSRDEKYVLDGLWCTFYDDEDMKKNGCVSGADYLASMKNDDVVEACYYINSDNSYGAMNMLAIRKIGENDGSAVLSEKLQVCFYPSVPNDKTGRSRLATTSTTTPIVGYALSCNNRKTVSLIKFFIDNTMYFVIGFKIVLIVVQGIAYNGSSS